MILSLKSSVGSVAETGAPTLPQVGSTAKTGALKGKSELEDFPSLGSSLEVSSTAWNFWRS